VADIQTSAAPHSAVVAAVVPAATQADVPSQLHLQPSFHPVYSPSYSTQQVDDNLMRLFPRGRPEVDTIRILGPRLEEVPHREGMHPYYHNRTLGAVVEGIDILAALVGSCLVGLGMSYSRNTKP